MAAWSQDLSTYRLLEFTWGRRRALAWRLGPQGVPGPRYRMRAVQAILRLEDTVGPRRLEAACVRALHFGEVRYRRIKQILNAALDQEPLPEAVPSFAPRAFAFARPAADFFAAIDGRQG